MSNRRYDQEWFDCVMNRNKKDIVKMLQRVGKERVKLDAELLEWQQYKENFARIMSDEFHIDNEHHCTCVPMLRECIKEQEAVILAAQAVLEKVKKRMEDNDETYYVINGVRCENQLYVDICAATLKKVGEK